MPVEDLRDSEGYTPLLRAALDGDYERMVEQMDRGADLFAWKTHKGEYHRYNVFHMLASKGDSNLLEQFCSYAEGREGFDKAINAFIDRKDGNNPGLTPFLVAINKGHIGCAFVLARVGIDPSISKVKPGNWSRYNPVHAAVGTGNIELVEALCKKPHVNLHHALNAFIDRDDGNNPGLSPLLMALINGKPDFAETCAITLLEAGASPYPYRERGGKKKNWHGYTPLHVAIRQGYSSVVKAMVDSDHEQFALALRTKIDRKYGNNPGLLPLTLAAKHGMQESQQSLLRSGLLNLKGAFMQAFELAKKDHTWAVMLAADVWDRGATPKEYCRVDDGSKEAVNNSKLLDRIQSHRNRKGGPGGDLGEMSLRDMCSRLLQAESDGVKAQAIRDLLRLDWGRLQVRQCIGEFGLIRELISLLGVSEVGYLANQLLCQLPMYTGQIVDCSCLSGGRFSRGQAIFVASILERVTSTADGRASLSIHQQAFRESLLEKLGGGFTEIQDHITHLGNENRRGDRFFERLFRVVGLEAKSLRKKRYDDWLQIQNNDRAREFVGDTDGRRRKFLVEFVRRLAVRFAVAIELLVNNSEGIGRFCTLIKLKFFYSLFRSSVNVGGLAVEGDHVHETVKRVCCHVRSRDLPDEITKLPDVMFRGGVRVSSTSILHKSPVISLPEGDMYRYSGRNFYRRWLPCQIVRERESFGPLGYELGM